MEKLEQIPELCRQQGVTLPEEDFARWLKGMSQWDQGRRGLFALPFFIKARLPGWRRRLAYLRTGCLPLPFRTHVWAAWYQYPTVKTTTWEDLFEHFGPRPDGSMPPFPGPIPVRSWPTDED